MWVIIVIITDIIIITDITTIIITDPGGPAVQGVGLRPLACWDCGLESLRRHGYLYPVSVLFCQVEVSATNRSLVQSRPTARVCVCVYVCVCVRARACLRACVCVCAHARASLSLSVTIISSPTAST